MSDLSRALVDLEINVRKLAQCIENKDTDAKRLINVILQDAYVVKSYIGGGHVDPYGSERCKAAPRIYAHIGSYEP